jgi:hypothetical protein
LLIILGVGSLLYVYVSLDAFFFINLL